MTKRRKIFLGIPALLLTCLGLFSGLSSFGSDFDPSLFVGSYYVDGKHSSEACWVKGFDPDQVKIHISGDKTYLEVSSDMRGYSAPIFAHFYDIGGYFSTIHKTTGDDFGPYVEFEHTWKPWYGFGKKLKTSDTRIEWVILPIPKHESSSLIHHHDGSLTFRGHSWETDEQMSCRLLKEKQSAIPKSSENTPQP